MILKIFLYKNGSRIYYVEERNGQYIYFLVCLQDLMSTMCSNYIPKIDTYNLNLIKKFNLFLIYLQNLLDSSEDYNVLKMYSKMADLQRTSTAFNYGKLETVIVSDEIYSFVRFYDGTDRYALITLV